MIYIILAHKEPESLRRLIKHLQDKDNYFVIHIDQKINVQDFIKATYGLNNCFFLDQRFRTNWGSFEIVEATLEAFNYIRNVLRKRQRIILLSGADFPLKTNKHIRSYLNANRDCIFIEYKPLPIHYWHLGGINRFPLYKKISTKLKLYGGSKWFSIPYKALAIIFDFIELNPEFVEYFKYVGIPDESFFQTLFLNCDVPFVNKNLRNKNLHFVKWDQPLIHPRILTMRDYKAIKKTRYLFGRKFDSVRSEELRSLLENNQSKTAVSEPKKTAIVFLTTNSRTGMNERFEKLVKEADDFDVFRLITEEEYFRKSENTILYNHKFYKKLGYTPFDKNNIIPGSTFFAILYFFKIKTDYDNYWLVEDDVWWNGNWKFFFKKFNNIHSDFIASYLLTYEDAPKWHWWNAITPIENLKGFRTRCFYPICRFSKRSLLFLDELLKSGLIGHGEVLIPTLLRANQFSLFDIDSLEEPVITPSPQKAIGNNNQGSFRFRPELRAEEIKGEYLFHPFKFH